MLRPEIDVQRTMWRVMWNHALRNEHTDHDTQEAADEAAARLQRAGVARVAVFPVVVQP